MVAKRVVITIRTLKESFEEARKVAREIDKGIFKKHDPEISFENYETFKKFLSQKRLELLRIIEFKKPKSIKDLSKMAHRDFKNVYDDIKILKTYDLIKLKKFNSGLMPTVIYDVIELRIPIKSRTRIKY